MECKSYLKKKYLWVLYLGDNCIVFENFTTSFGDLMVANWVYWQRVSRASKRIFATIKLTIDAVKFSNTIQLSPKYSTRKDFEYRSANFAHYSIFLLYVKKIELFSNSL